MILQNTVASNIIPYHQNFVNKILTQSKSFGDFGEKTPKSRTDAKNGCANAQPRSAISPLGAHPESRILNQSLSLSATEL